MPESSGRAEVTSVDAKAGQLRGLVLLVDDEKAVLDVTRMILEHFGFTVAAAQNGADALDRFDRQAAEFSIAIVDLTMPGMGGDLVFQRLRQARPEMPILLASGYTEGEMPAALTSQPRTGFLQKPYQASSLIGKVQQLLGTK